MIGWIGNIFLLVGVYYIGNKQKVGFLLTAFGEIIWIAYSVTISLWSLVAACVLFFGMSLRNWYKWYRDEKLEKALEDFMEPLAEEALEEALRDIEGWIEGDTIKLDTNGVHGDSPKGVDVDVRLKDES